jgi:hypothetical protein
MEKIMSFLNLTFPAIATLPAVEVAISTVLASARPILGVGILATMLVVFKPLLSGVLHAMLVLLQPKQTRAQKTARRNLRNMLTIRRMANDLDGLSPSMAAELRALASRG